MSKYEGYTEARKNASIKYMKENRDKLGLNLPKGKKDEIKEQAKGMSLNAYIVYLIENDPE